MNGYTKNFVDTVTGRYMQVTQATMMQTIQ